jgi:hypothetical protein
MGEWWTWPIDILLILFVIFGARMVCGPERSGGKYDGAAEGRPVAPVAED